MDLPDIEILETLAGGGGDASVELVRAAGRLLVLKRHRLRDIAAERAFHEALRRHDLPSLKIETFSGLGPDQILLEYVPGSPTIGGSPTPDLCRRWGGAVGALHQIRFEHCAVLDERGKLESTPWPDFITGKISEAIGRASGSDLPPSLLDQAEARLAQLLAFEPAGFVLTHGDLHLNNALVRGEEVVLFDKPAGVWAAPPVFDLCLVFSEGFPGARYGADREGDAERLDAFIEGYGQLPAEHDRWLEHFVLLRALRRYPSPFVPEMRAIIEIALDRINSPR